MAKDDETAMLREAAKARGFKLVKSRRRKAGGDFGKYGLTDAKGRECFGFGANGLTGDADAVLAYLRGGETASWKRSLMGVVGGKEAKPRAEKKAPKVSSPAHPPKPVRFERSRETSERDSASMGRPLRKRLSTSLETNGESEAGTREGDGEDTSLTIRPATPKDATALAHLLDADPRTLKKNLATLAKTIPPLVAERDAVVGVIAWAIVLRLDAPPIARITSLFVAEADRREGIATALLTAADAAIAKTKATESELLLDIALDAPAGFLRKTGWTRSANAYRRVGR